MRAIKLFLNVTILINHSLLSALLSSFWITLISLEVCEAGSGYWSLCIGHSKLSSSFTDLFIEASIFFILNFEIYLIQYKVMTMDRKTRYIATYINVRSMIQELVVKKYILYDQDS